MKMEEVGGFVRNGFNHGVMEVRLDSIEILQARDHFSTFVRVDVDAFLRLMEPQLSKLAADVISELPVLGGYIKEDQTPLAVPALGQSFPLLHESEVVEASLPFGSEANDPLTSPPFAHHVAAVGKRTHGTVDVPAGRSASPFRLRRGKHLDGVRGEQGDGNEGNRAEHRQDSSTQLPQAFTLVHPIPRHSVY